MKSSVSLTQLLPFKNKRLATFLLATVTSISAGAFADDTEVFFGQKNTQTNVLFIIDASGSMSWYDDPNPDNDPTTNDYSYDPYYDGDQTRLEKLQDALTEIISTTNNINVGLLSFADWSNGEGFTLHEEIRPVSENRQSMQASIDGLTAGGGTPTPWALLEGGQYFRGEPMQSTGVAYDSPMVSACQSNHIVLLTDGEPYLYRDTATIVPKWIYGDDTTTTCAMPSLEGGICGTELAQYLYETDHSDLNDHNNIITHTIGLNFSEAWLATVSAAGGGQHFNAESASDLLVAFDSILEATDSSNTFAAPAITLDKFTGFSHRDDIYLALFQPDNSQRWAGNLKRYQFDGQVNDAAGNLALDVTTGSFLPEARSYWSTTADGGDVTLGGAANLFNESTRNVYTYTGGDKALTGSHNKVHEDTSEITSAMLGVSPGERNNLLRWARGVDVDNETSGSDSRLKMGDPLHSRPTILTYGGSKTTPDSVVFIGTNEGFLHAINSADGQEVFSFIPTNLLGNLDTYYQNKRSINRLYGLDGDLTLWVNDEDNNGQIDTDSQDHAYLYMGMRRGGSHYYALDVTAKTAPKFLWSIEGGAGGTEGFEKLAQSWSKPTRTKVTVAGAEKDVLIFGGGYNPTLDHSNQRSADNTGNDVFIVDATSGDLIWNSATAANSLLDTNSMQYSIPSDLRIIDINGDQFADQIYFGDMGGQLWRFDIDNNNSDTDSLVSGGVIANLAADSSIADNRQFFYPPDVALVKSKGKRFLSISIGSGNRAHPLGVSVNNRFYMIRQESITSAPEGYGIAKLVTGTEEEYEYRAITEDDLYNATTNLIQSDDVEISGDASAALRAKAGWLLEMQGNGEKVLASSLTVSNEIFFTSYLPEIVTNDSCSPTIGTSRSYSVRVFDATPTNGTTAESRYETLTAGGIPTEPTAVINENGEIDVVVGLEKVANRSPHDVTRVYWTEQPDY